MDKENRTIVRVNHFTISVDVIKEIVISPTESEFVSYSIGILELVEKGLVPTYNLKGLEEYFKNEY